MDCSFTLSAIRGAHQVRFVGVGRNYNLQVPIGMQVLPRTRLLIKSTKTVIARNHASLTNPQGSVQNCVGITLIAAMHVLDIEGAG